MEEEYEKYMCSTCTNKQCSKQIVKIQKRKILIVKCNDYKKQPINREEYLTKYLNDMKMRNYRNDS